jgi:hypothetical protein
LRSLKKITQSILGTFNLQYQYGRIQKIHSHEPRSHYNGKKILSLAEGNDLIKTKLKAAKPFLTARIGYTELSVLFNYLSYRDKSKIKWNPRVKNNIWELSGVFPNDHESLVEFSSIYLDAIGKVDALGVWFNEGEEMVAKRYCPDANLILLESIEPYYFDDPWSSMLENKKVLIIHPFEASIKKQYSTNRDLIFPSSAVLPPFKLEVIKAVQSIAFNTTGHQSWFQALQKMKNQILGCDFDIAIIGAGAYGLPLAAYVKELGKQAIHMGGATQVLFGIRGKRWDNHPVISKLYNENWIRPSHEEIVPQAHKVEDGCYW